MGVHLAPHLPPVYHHPQLQQAPLGEVLHGHLHHSHSMDRRVLLPHGVAGECWEPLPSVFRAEVPPEGKPLGLLTLASFSVEHGIISVLTFLYANISCVPESRHHGLFPLRWEWGFGEETRKRLLWAWGMDKVVGPSFLGSPEECKGRK